MARTGITILEMIVSLVIISTVMLTGTQLLSIVAHQRRAAVRRQVALNETANMMERAMALSWEQLNNQRAGEIALSQTAREQLPGAEATIKVESAPTPDSDLVAPPAKRVQVRLSWKNSAGQTAAPIELTAWKYAADEK